MGLVWLMPSLAAFAVVVSVGLLALLPTRRLFLAGWGPRALFAYLVTIVGLGLLAIEARSAARYVVPILVLAYLAPFVTPPPLIARLLGPGARRPPPKDVTPRPPALRTGTPPEDGPDPRGGHDASDSERHQP